MQPFTFYTGKHSKGSFFFSFFFWVLKCLWRSWHQPIDQRKTTTTEKQQLKLYLILYNSLLVLTMCMVSTSLAGVFDPSLGPKSDTLTSSVILINRCLLLPVSWRSSLCKTFFFYLTHSTVRSCVTLFIIFFHIYTISVFDCSVILCLGWSWFVGGRGYREICQV